MCVGTHGNTIHYITLHYITLHYITIQYITIQYNTIHIFNLWYPSSVWAKFAVQVSTGAVNSLTCCLLLLQCTVDRVPKPADLRMKLATNSYSIDFTGLLFFVKWRLSCWTIKSIPHSSQRENPLKSRSCSHAASGKCNFNLGQWTSTSTGVVAPKGAKKKRQKSR